MAAVSAPPSRIDFCPGPKGGLFAWESVRHFSTVILVEGLLDLAVLWQAGFRNTTCAFGTHLTPLQFHQLSEQPDRLVYIVFDQDENQAGQRAAHQLARRLAGVSVPARMVQLPAGHDPNSYFVAGATAADFADCLEGRTRYETRLGPSICHPTRHLPLSPARRARSRNRLGQRFSGCPAYSSTVAALAARLRL